MGYHMIIEDKLYVLKMLKKSYCVLRKGSNYIFLRNPTYCYNVLLSHPIHVHFKSQNIKPFTLLSHPIHVHFKSQNIKPFTTITGKLPNYNVIHMKAILHMDETSYSNFKLVEFTKFLEAHIICSTLFLS